jgi:hypothetical protein
VDISKAWEIIRENIKASVQVIMSWNNISHGLMESSKLLDQYKMWKE